MTTKAPSIDAVLTRTADEAPRAAPSRVVRVAALGALVSAISLGVVAVIRWDRLWASSGSAIPAARTGCASNAECIASAGGAPSLCSFATRVCVPIASEDCRPLFEPGDLEREDTIWLGALLPTTGPEAARFENDVLAIDLARSDFAEVLGTSAGRQGHLHARGVAVVLCDDAANPARAANHLVADLNVPAVLGFGPSPASVQTIPSTFLPYHVLVFVTANEAPEVTQFPSPPYDPRLVWRSTVNSGDIGRPIAAVVANVLEPEARAAGAREAALRVALVRPPARLSDPSDAIFRALHFNGKSALENGNNFRQYVVDPVSASSPRAALDALVAFAPHVIIAQDEAVRNVLIEKLSAIGGKDLAVPYVIHGSSFSEAELRFVARSAARRRRFLGIVNEGSTMANAQLALHFNVARPGNPITRAGTPSASYDGFYTLAYAALALGDGTVTGPALSSAIGLLLPPGPKIEVGPGSIFEAFDVLRSGRNVDLEGATGMLDFSPGSGESPINYAIVCMGTDASGAASGAVASGLVYDAVAMKMRGTKNCP